MKLSTSKLLAGSICVFGMIMTIFYYVTIWLGYDCDPAVAVASISEIIASVLGYLIFSMKTKDSRNKYGIGKDGLPFCGCGSTPAEEKMEEIIEDEEEAEG